MRCAWAFAGTRRLAIAKREDRLAFILASRQGNIIRSRRVRERIASVLSVALAVGILACARTATVKKPAPPEPSLEGRSSLRFLQDEARAQDELRAQAAPGAEEATEQLISPTPSTDNALPPYPESALRARYGAAFTVVRAVIDSEGHVVHVAPSPRLASSEGPFARDFRAVADEAVGQWRFAPALRQRQLPSGRLERKPIAVYVDVRFDFTIVEGKGQVRSGIH